jgi:hypothetical protein
VPSPAPFVGVAEGEVSGVVVPVQVVPAFGVESVRLVPEPGIAMAQQGEQQDVVPSPGPVVDGRQLGQHLLFPMVSDSRRNSDAPR